MNQVHDRGSSLATKGRTSPRHAILLVTGIAAVLGMGGAGVATMSGFFFAKSANIALPTSRELPRTSTAVSLVRALTSAGLEPKALAASGVSSQQATALVDAGAAALTDQGIDVGRSVDAVLAATNDVDRLESQVRSTSGTREQREALVASLNAARTTLTNAQSARDTAIASFIAAATAGLNEQQKASLATIRANHDREVPVQYKTVNHTDSEWVRLREAFSASRIASQRGEQPSASVAEVMSQADANVSTAASNVSKNLASVNTAWLAAVKSGR